MIGDPSQLSIEVALPVLAGNELAEHWMILLLGHEIVGATLSMRVIVWLQVLSFPQLSVACQVLIIT